MAATSGVGQHRAWLNVNGTTMPIITGSVTQNATRRTSTFHGTVPLSYDGAYDTLSTVGDNQTTITVTTRGTTGTLVTGELDDVDFDLIGRVIRFKGRDESGKLHDNKTSEKWQNKSTTDIINDLLGRVGISGTAGGGAMAGKILHQDFVKLTDNVSFAYVIHKLAEYDGARWWIDGQGNFNYAKFGNPTGSYSISIDQSNEPIKSDCLSLKIKRNIPASKEMHVSVKAWHPRWKQVFSHTAIIPGNGGPIPYNYHIPTLVQDQVEQHAKSQANEKARHEFTVSASVVGDPSVSAGMGLTLSGTTYFDQSFDIDVVQHDIGMNGHTTHITARSAKDGREAS